MTDIIYQGETISKGERKTFPTFAGSITVAAIPSFELPNTHIFQLNIIDKKVHMLFAKYFNDSNVSEFLNDGLKMLNIFSVFQKSELEILIQNNQELRQTGISADSAIKKRSELDLNKQKEYELSFKLNDNEKRITAKETITYNDQFIASYLDLTKLTQKGMDNIIDGTKSYVHLNDVSKKYYAKADMIRKNFKFLAVQCENTNLLAQRIIDYLPKY